jgi:hypothetical protein
MQRVRDENDIYGSRMSTCEPFLPFGVILFQLSNGMCTSGVGEDWELMSAVERTACQPMGRLSDSPDNIPPSQHAFDPFFRNIINVLGGTLLKSYHGAMVITSSQFFCSTAEKDCSDPT